MKILLTGGAGFIGRWVVKKLLEQEMAKKNKHNIRVVELFAGVGGFRCGLNSIRTNEDTKKIILEKAI